MCQLQPCILPLALCSGDLCFCHENHRLGDLLCCQVLSEVLSLFSSLSADNKLNLTLILFVL